MSSIPVSNSTSNISIGSNTTSVVSITKTTISTTAKQASNVSSGEQPRTTGTNTQTTKLNLQISTSQPSTVTDIALPIKTVAASRACHKLSTASASHQAKTNTVTNVAVATQTKMVSQMEITQNETNFLRFMSLVLKIGPRALRQLFDTYNPPECLHQRLVDNRNKLKDFLDRRKITRANWNIIFPENENASSRNFDLKLMLLLLRVLSDVDIPKAYLNTLPPPNDTGIGADLERLRHYRNMVEHSATCCMNACDFTSAWEDLSQAIIRIGGQGFASEVSSLFTADLDSNYNDLYRELKTKEDRTNPLNIKNPNAGYRYHQMVRDEQKELMDTKHAESRFFEKEGDDFFKEHLYEKAIECYSRSIALDNRNFRLNLKRGNAFFRLCKYKEAEEEFCNVIRQNVNDFDTILKRGLCRKHLQKFATALEDFDKTMELDPNNVDAKIERDKLLQWINKPGQFNPDVALELKKMGNEYISKGEYRHAIDAYTAGIQLDPFAKQIMFNRGVAYFHLDLYECAMKDFRSVLKLDPNHAKATEYMASASTEIKRLDPYKKMIDSISRERTNYELLDTVPYNIRDQHNSILAEWVKEDMVYFETKSSKEVYKAITKHQVTTVTGNAGSGKSATIHHVALQMRRKGYDVLPVMTPEDISRYLQPKTRQLFVLDDPFGTHTLDKDVFKLWLRYNTLLDSVLSSEKSKIICSIRKQIVNDPDFKIANCQLNKVIIDLQDEENKLTEEEKLGMIKQHLKLNKKSFVITPMAKLTFKNTKESFPLACKMFCSREFQGVGWKVFADPFSLVLDDLTKIQSQNKVKYDVLILCFVLGNYISQDLFDPSSAKNLKSTLDPRISACDVDTRIPLSEYLHATTSLTGVYLRNEGQCYRFSHDLIYDVVAYHFGKNYPNLLVKVGSSKFICDRIIVNDTMYSENDRYLVCLPSRHFSDLIERLMLDLKQGKYNYSMMSKCWDDEKFMQKFIEFFNDTKNTDYILSIFLTAYQKNKGELKQEQGIGVSESFDTWSWYYRALAVLSEEGITPLHWAVTFAHSRLFRFIWQNCILTQKKQIVKAVPLLHLACLGGDIDICKTILQAEGDKLDTPYLGKGDLPLHYAACKSADVLKFLIDRAADVNVKSRVQDQTPLQYAAGYGNERCCDVLIRHGADVNLSDIEGCSPLFLSAKNDHIGVAQILIRHGADVNLCNNKGLSPLMVSVRTNHSSIVTLLINHKAKLNPQKGNSMTPLIMASNFNSIDALRVLLENNYDVNQQDLNGWTALMFACNKNHTEIAHLLLEHNCDVNLQNFNEWSALMFACLKNHKEIVQVLLKHNCDVNLQNVNGWSALMFACNNYHKEIVQLLLNHNCDVSLRDDMGKTAVMIARNNDATDIIEMLQGHKK